LFSPQARSSAIEGEGRFSQTTTKIPFHRVYNEFPVATADPNRMRDMGVEKGNSYSGGPQKHAYRLTNLNHMAANSSLKDSAYWSNASKRSRGFMSIHALDGLTNYYGPHKEDNTKIFNKPL
jgi:hypothetical protein